MGAVSSLPLRAADDQHHVPTAPSAPNDTDDSGHAADANSNEAADRDAKRSGEQQKTEDELRNALLSMTRKLERLREKFDNVNADRETWKARAETAEEQAVTWKTRARIAEAKLSSPAYDWEIREHWRRELPKILHDGVESLEAKAKRFLRYNKNAREELNGYQNQLRSEKEKIRSAKALVQMIEEDGNDAFQLKTENARLQADITSNEETHKKLEEQNEKLQKQDEKLQKQNDTLEKQNGSLREQNGTQKEQNDALNVELKNRNDAMERLRNAAKSSKKLSEDDIDRLKEFMTVVYAMSDADMTSLVDSHKTENGVNTETKIGDHRIHNLLETACRHHGFVSRSQDTVDSTTQTDPLQGTTTTNTHTDPLQDTIETGTQANLDEEEKQPLDHKLQSMPSVVDQTGVTSHEENQIPDDATKGSSKGQHTDDEATPEIQHVNYAFIVQHLPDLLEEKAIFRMIIEWNFGERFQSHANEEDWDKAIAILVETKKAISENDGHGETLRSYTETKESIPDTALAVSSQTKPEESTDSQTGASNSLPAPDSTNENVDAQGNGPADGAQAGGNTAAPNQAQDAQDNVSTGGQQATSEMPVLNQGQHLQVPAFGHAPSSGQMPSLESTSSAGQTSTFRFDALAISSVPGTSVGLYGTQQQTFRSRTKPAIRRGRNVAGSKAARYTSNLNAAVPRQMQQDETSKEVPAETKSSAFNFGGDKQGVVKFTEGQEQSQQTQADAIGSLAGLTVFRTPLNHPQQAETQSPCSKPSPPVAHPAVNDGTAGLSHPSGSATAANPASKDETEAPEHDQEAQMNTQKSMGSSKKYCDRGCQQDCQANAEMPGRTFVKFWLLSKLDKQPQEPQLRRVLKRTFDTSYGFLCEGIWGEIIEELRTSGTIIVEGNGELQTIRKRPADIEEDMPDADDEDIAVSSPAQEDASMTGVEHTNATAANIPASSPPQIAGPAVNDSTAMDGVEQALPLPTSEAPNRTGQARPPPAPTAPTVDEEVEMSETGGESHTMVSIPSPAASASGLTAPPKQPVSQQGTAQYIGDAVAPASRSTNVSQGVSRSFADFAPPPRSAPPSGPGLSRASSAATKGPEAPGVGGSNVNLGSSRNKAQFGPSSFMSGSSKAVSSAPPPPAPPKASEAVPKNQPKVSHPCYYQPHDKRDHYGMAFPADNFPCSNDKKGKCVGDPTNYEPKDGTIKPNVDVGRIYGGRNAVEEATRKDTAKFTQKLCFACFVAANPPGSEDNTMAVVSDPDACFWQPHQNGLKHPCKSTFCVGEPAKYDQTTGQLINPPTENLYEGTSDKDEKERRARAKTWKLCYECAIEKEERKAAKKNAETEEGVELGKTKRSNEDDGQNKKKRMTEDE